MQAIWYVLSPLKVPMFFSPTNILDYDHKTLRLLFQLHLPQTVIFQKRSRFGTITNGNSSVHSNIVSIVTTPLLILCTLCGSLVLNKSQLAVEDTLFLTSCAISTEAVSILLIGCMEALVS